MPETLLEKSMKSKMSEMSEVPETLCEKSMKSKMSGMSLMPETLFVKFNFSLVLEISEMPETFQECSSSDGAKSKNHRFAMLVFSMWWQE